MFKKNPNVKAAANLKSSERRKLLATICTTYGVPQAQLGPETERQILPAVTKQATFKSELGYTGTIFTDETQTPTWFKTKDSQLIPSIYTLWRCPFLLPIVLTHPHVVKQHMANGADLMLPGTVPPFDARATKGKIVAIAATDRPTVPMAVGECNFDMPLFERVIGRLGVAVTVLHHVGDELCGLCKEDMVAPAVGVSSAMPLAEPVGVDASTVAATTPNEDAMESLVESTTKHTIDDGCENGRATTQAVGKNPIAEEGAPAVTVSTEDVDHLFERALIQTLHKDNIVVPLLASTFMANHVLKNLPDVDGSLVNMKRTSWKKAAKFLKAMEKLGFLKLKGRDDDMAVVAVVGKENETVKNFVTHKVKKLLAAGASPQSKSELTMLLLYKPTHKAKPFFELLGEPFGVLYTAPELKVLLNRFVAAQQLADPKNPKNLIPDGNLCAISGLPRGSVAREKVFPAFLKNFTELHKIIKPNQDPEEAPLGRGPIPVITIVTELRLGRKIITRISNFEAFHIKAEPLAEELRVKCSGATTIGPCTHNPKLTEVMVQGPHGKLVMELLGKRGVAMLYLKFEDKLKGKKRK